MKTSTLLILMLSLISQAYAAEGQSGNGGGGISRNGRYMTFYSAGFYTEPAESTSEEVPQLQELVSFFYTTPYMNAITRVAYASKLMPSSARSYYKVQANSFTPEIRARLIAEYSRVMNVDTKELALFAITDTTSQTTYLFPEFFSLTPVEQKAILFHEAYWLIQPRSDYSHVVQAEMSFQAYLQNPASPDRLLNWLRNSGTSGDVMKASLQTDLQTKAMDGLIKRNNEIVLGDILGADFFHCRAQGETSSCVPFIQVNLYTLSQKYPKSLFIRLLLDAANRDKLRFLGDTLVRSSLVDDKYMERAANASIDLMSASYADRASFLIKMGKYSDISMEIID